MCGRWHVGPMLRPGGLAASPYKCAECCKVLDDRELARFVVMHRTYNRMLIAITDQPFPAAIEQRKKKPDAPA